MVNKKEKVPAQRRRSRRSHSHWAQGSRGQKIDKTPRGGPPGFLVTPTWNPAIKRSREACWSESMFCRWQT